MKVYVEIERFDADGNKVFYDREKATHYKLIAQNRLEVSKYKVIKETVAESPLFARDKNGSLSFYGWTWCYHASSQTLFIENRLVEI